VVDGLDAIELSAVMSCLTFESRGSAEDAPTPRQAVVVERLGAIETVAGALRRDERRFGLRRSRRPDGGLARAVVGWASGAPLDRVLRDAEVAPGDFVRNIRQLIDLLRQVGQVAQNPATAEAAEMAQSLLRRGVVGADDPAGLGSALPGSSGS
jgi:ATP-dependent RNA helicase HelY